MNITCVGALNWDRKLRLGQALALGSSNPVSHLAGAAGGVAFNLARHLARERALHLRLVSAWGSDPEGQRLQQAAQEAGVELLGLQRPECASGQYTAVLDAQGELVLALADMAVLDNLPEAFWHSAAAALQRSDAAVLDLNLEGAGLARLCAVARERALPLALVAVSVPKMRHLPDDLRGVDLLLLNRDELAALGHGGVDALATAWAALHARGLRALLVTCGADGLSLCDASGVHHLSAPERVQAVDVTGAGDALSAQTLRARWVEGLSVCAAAQRGQAAAARVLQSLESV